MKIFITGIAGSGKTTIIEALTNRGDQALDLDACGICAWINRETGKTATYKEGAGKDWIKEHRWQVIIPRLTELLSTLDSSKNIYVGGKVASSQMDEIVKIFDVIYLLKPDDSIVGERLVTRTSNKGNFAKTQEERDMIIRNRDKFEKACLEVGAIILENCGGVDKAVLKLKTV